MIFLTCETHLTVEQMDRLVQEVKAATEEKFVILPKGVRAHSFDAKRTVVAIDALTAQVLTQQKRAKDEIDEAAAKFLADALVHARFAILAAEASK